MNALQKIQQKVLELDPCDQMKQIIEESFDVASLNESLVLFQNHYKRGAFTPEQTALLVAAGKKKRSELSAAEGKPKSIAQQALSKAKIQGFGATSPHPDAMHNDEHELYQLITGLDPELQDAFTQLERLQLRYMERDRSEYGKKWLVPAFTKKLREIESAWAKKAEDK